MQCSRFTFCHPSQVFPWRGSTVGVVPKLSHEMSSRSTLSFASVVVVNLSGLTQAARCLCRQLSVFNSTPHSALYSQLRQQSSNTRMILPPTRFRPDSSGSQHKLWPRCFKFPRARVHMGQKYQLQICESPNRGSVNGCSQKHCQRLSTRAGTYS
jgi:hypothetical protein